MFSQSILGCCWFLNYLKNNYSTMQRLLLRCTKIAFRSAFVELILHAMWCLRAADSNIIVVLPTSSSTQGIHCNIITANEYQ